MSRPQREFIGIALDYETKSRTDIKHGSYKYCEDPDFAILRCAFAPMYRYAGGAMKYGAIRSLDLTNQEHVVRFQKLLLDSTKIKRAYNANFERIASSAWIGLPPQTYIDPAGWYCSAIRANVHGVFGRLGEVAKAVRAPVGKDTEGRRLINLFSKPDNKRGGLFHDGVAATCWCGSDHRADFDRFDEYCKQDVLTEAVVSREFPDPHDFVQREYEMDQRINDRGIGHHKELAEQAVKQVEIEKDRLMDKLRSLTGVDNPNSGPQMQGWLADQGYPMLSLDKDHRDEALADPLIPDDVAKALTLKGAASLSSVTKHKAALNSRCVDGRLRGTLQFYGAHTGREAGRTIQPQNLPRYEAPDEDRRRLLKGKAKKHAPRIAKGTVRASLVPARGHVFVTADYNAIEARVLAGLAGEKWAEEEFRGSGKIYERTATMMFKVDYDRLVAARKACDGCGKTTCQACVTRGKGKVSNLALGYAGGAGALVTMGAEEAGIDCGNYSDLHADWVEAGSPGKFHEWNQDLHDYPELLRMRDLYRTNSPMTVGFWKLCAQAWDSASAGKGVRFGQERCLAMVRDGKHNRLVLPSGRDIWYRYARSHPSDTNPDHIERRTFMGKGKGVGHIRTDTHGGKLTENATQAVARDVLFDLMRRIEKKTAKGWPGRIVLHVHDEVVLEVPVKHAEQVLADTVGMMSVAPKWGKFLIVKGEGKIMERYGK